ncbi:MAG: M14-type cytosolic carboxypeptidase, partial [Pseudomonadota bacterium]
MIKISSGFDGGNITCIRCDDPTDIALEINKDHQADFYQWFYFRLSGAAGEDCRL